jgi:hypothetical protein
MKRILPLAPILALGLLVLLQCGDDGDGPTTPSGSITYLRTDHYGCGGPSGKSRDTTDCAFLTASSYDGSNLALTVHFRANCCPAFVSTVKVTDRSVEIALEDTLRGCRCTCAYEDDFVFSCPSPGDLAVKFQAGSETCAFDTLISVQR